MHAVDSMGGSYNLPVIEIQIDYLTLVLHAWAYGIIPKYMQGSIILQLISTSICVYICVILT